MYILYTTQKKTLDREAMNLMVVNTFFVGSDQHDCHMAG